MLRTHSGYINTDHCRLLRCRWNKQDPYTSHLHGEFSDGSNINEPIAYDTWQEFEDGISNNSHLIPSPPGYTLLTYCFNRKAKILEPKIERADVLAFVFDSDLGFHRVFTAWDYPQNFNGYCGILCPNGTVADPGSQLFDNFDAWLAEMTENAKRDIQKNLDADAAKLKTVPK